MSEEQDSLPDLPIGGLREITLRIPGECFFCEALNMPANLLKEADRHVEKWREKVEDFVLQSLGESSLSPYPPEQLAWGFHGCDQSGKVIVFATPLARLKQLVGKTLSFSGGYFLLLSVFLIMFVKVPVWNFCFTKTRSL